MELGLVEQRYQGAALDDRLCLSSVSGIPGCSGWQAGSWRLGCATPPPSPVSFSALGHPLDLGVSAGRLRAGQPAQRPPRVDPGLARGARGHPGGHLRRLRGAMAASAAAVLGYRLVSYWLPVLAGLPFALGTLRSFRPAAFRRIAPRTPPPSARSCGLSVATRPVGAEADAPGRLRRAGRVHHHPARQRWDQMASGSANTSATDGFPPRCGRWLPQTLEHLPESDPSDGRWRLDQLRTSPCNAWSKANTAVHHE